MKDYLKEVHPRTQEALLAIFFAGIIGLIFFSYADVVFHDNYVLPIIAGCYENNNKEFCDGIREINGCEIGEDRMCIGEAYWKVLPTLLLAFGIFVGVVRIVFGRWSGADINGMLFLLGLLWFLTAIILPYTGWADYVYYMIKDEPVPDELPWLNDVGFLSIINVGDDPNNVEKEDLYFVMGIGFIIMIFMWIGAMHMHNKGMLQRLA